MADKVADLYAKIGFNVNEDGFKKAKKLLQELAQQLSALNGLSQKHAKENGIFSKKQLSELKHNQTMERLILKEKIQDKRFHQKEQEHLWRMEERASKTHHSNMTKYARQGAKGLLGIARNSMKLLAHTTQATWKSVIAPSLSGAVNVRDFMMYTGTPLEELQRVQERFASIGSSMSREDIMGELSSVMDNLTKIRFGEGELGGFKLSGIAGFAASRNVSKVLSMIDEQIASTNIDNQALVHVLDKMGFSGQKWLPYFRARQRVNTILPRLSQEGQDQLVNAQSSVQVLTLGLKRSGEILTSKFAPVIQSLSDKIIDFLNGFTQNVDVEKVGKIISDLLKDFADWLNKITADDVKKGIEGFINGIKSIFNIINKFGEWIENIPWLSRITKTRAERILNGEEKTSFQNLYEGLGEKAEKRPSDLVDDMFFMAKHGVKNYKEYLDRRDILRNFKETGVAAPSKVVYLTDNSSQTNTFNGLENEEFADSVIAASSSAFKKYTIRGVLEDVIGTDLFTLQGLGQNMGGTSGY